ncbi:MAG: hypothetical protein DCF21_18730 [Leptolyngbya sp.]|nr:MAG: hypothetical protein DCF21_18730 [Leptolyngbya sp.]
MNLYVYIYTLQDSYKSLRSHVEKVDLIFYRYGSWSDLDTIQISGLYIPYLELFVGLRWCLRTLFLGDSKKKQKSSFSPAIQTEFRKIEDNLPIVDKIFWELRNEIHHSHLSFLQPSEWSIGGGGRKELERVAGLFLPYTPNALKKNEDTERKIKNFYQTNSTSEMIKVRFIDALNQHYEALLPFHESALKIIQKYSEDKFGRPIQTRLQNFPALITKE